MLSQSRVVMRAMVRPLAHAQPLERTAFNNSAQALDQRAVTRATNFFQVIVIPPFQFDDTARPAGGSPAGRKQPTLSVRPPSDARSAAAACPGRATRRR